LRKTIRTIVLIFLLGISLLAVFDLINEIQSKITIIQSIAMISQVMYAILGIAGFVGILMRHPRTKYMLIGWGIALTVTGTLTPVAWGGTGIAVAAAAFVASAIIAGLVIWGGVRTGFPK